MTEAMTTYILELTNGNLRKVTVPSAWKVTFGPAVPFSPGKGPTYNVEHKGYAIRFYEKNKENQRAIFTDVRSFRDSAIQIEERVTSSKKQNMRKETKGGFRDVEVEARVTEWINPDEAIKPTSEFLAIEDRSTNMEF